MGDYSKLRVMVPKNPTFQVGTPKYINDRAQVHPYLTLPYLRGGQVVTPAQR